MLKPSSPSFTALNLLLASVLTAPLLAAPRLLVENGDPRASIVIAEDPPRLVDLAARELQTYVEKLSGATLPISTASDPAHPVTIYVGRSAFTDVQGITDEGLYHGAYRMVSGPDWLVLLGRDRDFEPREPWPRNRNDIQRAQRDWEEIYGGPGDNPMGPCCPLFNHYNRTFGIWKHDEGGSLQAVYALLRDWGVRWFMPGELGEVVPEIQTLALPAADRTVHPDFAIRNLHWYNRFAMTPDMDDIDWWLRLGLNPGSSVLGVSVHTHGLRSIHGNETMQTQHPEYFALYGGVRDTAYRGTGHACFSSEGLQREAVKYLRAAFDHFGEPAMDLWPQDGYHHCGCELCEGHSPSDLVFGFLDRVAREVYETHPDRLVTSGAYTVFVHPPENIERFSPNVAIFIANQTRPGLVLDHNWERYQERVEAWREKLAPGNLIRVENNLYNAGRNGGRLVIHPRAFARDLQALKGISMGDWNEVPRGRPSGTQWENPGVNHLNYYVNASLLWDADQDIDALLEDYFTRFYGPAADAMQAAFDYAEAHYLRRGRPYLPLEHRLRFVEMLAQARAIAGETRYGRRIAAIQAELPGSAELRAELQAILDAGDPRQNAPTAVGQHLPATDPQPTYRLRGIVDGADPEVETTFTVGWEEGTLVFDITCQEPEMENLFVTPDVWGGDSLAILLETPFHSYYQIEINPDGVVFDADREFSVATSWNSLADVHSERGADFWRLIVRLPIMPVEEGAADPLHNVVGEKPGADAPWFFNLGRARVRGVGGQDRTVYTFSPVGHSNYHQRDRFAKLLIE